MGHAAASRVIRAPVETVFGYVGDYRNTTRYLSDLERWEPVGDVVAGIGSRFEVVLTAGPKAVRALVEIDAWQQNTKIGWSSLEGVELSASWRFVPRGAGTEAFLDLSYDLGGGIAGKVMARAAGPSIRSGLECSLARLKEQTERLAEGPDFRPKPAPSRSARARRIEPESPTRRGAPESAP